MKETKETKEMKEMKGLVQRRCSLLELGLCCAYIQRGEHSISKYGLYSGNIEASLLCSLKVSFMAQNEVALRGPSSA